MNAYYLSGFTIYSVAMLPSNGCWGRGVLGARMYECLQSTTPVLLCTTKDYSSTTLYYYLVLQSTTPVLPCTTKYYSSTTLY